MRTIHLSNGKVALVDDEDFERVSALRWHDSGHGYARANRMKKTVYMHHLIAGKPGPTERVDHIDRDGLNNRRANLRIVKHAVNNRNRRPTKDFRGVFSHGTKKKSCFARAVFQGEKVYLGTFTSRVRAAIAYDNAVMLQTGDATLLNFKTIRQRKAALRAERNND